MTAIKATMVMLATFLMMLAVVMGLSANGNHHEQEGVGVISDGYGISAHNSRH